MLESGLVIKVCLHVTSAFACAFDANYGIHGTKWRCLHLQLCLRVRVTQRMGWEPILPFAFASDCSVVTGTK